MSDGRAVKTPFQRAALTLVGLVLIGIVLQSWLHPGWRDSAVFPYMLVVLPVVLAMSTWSKERQALQPGHVAPATRLTIALGTGAVGVGVVLLLAWMTARQITPGDALFVAAAILVGTWVVVGGHRAPSA